MSQTTLDGVSNDWKRQAKHIYFQNGSNVPSFSNNILYAYSGTFVGKLNISNFPSVRRITFHYNVNVSALESIDISENMELNKISICEGSQTRSNFYTSNCVFLIKERQLNQIALFYYEYNVTNTSNAWVETYKLLKHQAVVPCVLVENGRKMEQLETEIERLNKAIAEKDEQIKKLKEENEKTPTLNQFQELVDIVFSPNTDLDFDGLKDEVKELKLKDYLPYYKKEKENFTKLISGAKENAGSNLEKFLDLLLLIQKQLIEKNQESDSYAQGQLSAYQIILQEKLDPDDLEALLNEQKKILKLEKQLRFLQNDEYS